MKPEKTIEEGLEYCQQQLSRGINPISEELVKMVLKDCVDRLKDGATIKDPVKL